MSRSKWKIPYINKYIARWASLNKRNKDIFKTRDRSTVISANWLDKNIFVYNGIHFVELKIQKNMIGNKLGDFILTRKKTSSKKK